MINKEIAERLDNLATFYEQEEKKSIGIFSLIDKRDTEILRAAAEIVSKVDKGELVEVVHAEWLEDGDVQICSNCGEEHEWQDYRATYCEDCGAKMDGEPNQEVLTAIEKSNKKHTEMMSKLAGEVKDGAEK